MNERAKLVIESMKQALDVFEKMELPFEEREFNLEYDSVMAIISGFEQVTRERDALQVEIDVLNEEYYAGIHTIRPAVDAMPKWISVKERLPEIGDQVLVTDDFGCVGTGTCDTFGYRRHISVDGCSQFGCIPTVKYWMPLPSAPEVKQ